MRGKTPAVIAALAAFALTWAGSATPVQRPQAVPREQEQPRVSGTTRAGRDLTTSTGRWANSPTSFSYRWERCETRAATGCTAIAGNTRIYRLVEADVGKFIRSWVTACNADGCAQANSRPVGPVTASAAPRNTAVPRIAGSAVAGQTLTGDPGQWSAGVRNFDFQWQRCDSAGNACTAIAGANRRTYTLTNADLGRRLRLLVTARNNVGATSAISAATEVVQEPGPAGAIKLPSGETSIPVSSVALPQRLVISGVKFEPSVVRSRAEPLVGRFRVTDTRGFVVRDALVYAIGVPPNRVSLTGEAVTAQDGWATITYRILPRQPIARGVQITFFVRARKPGDDPLAGVSSRRLVSLRASPR
jgi:hypothetical protein